MGFLRFVLRRLAGAAGQPRIIRRVEMHCPHDQRVVEIDLLMGRTGMPTAVLRCNARSETPPTCDQLCRRRAEAVIGPARGLFLVPPGDGPPDELGG